MFSEQSHAFFYFFFLCLVGVAKDYYSCVFYLVAEELAEVFKIHFALVYIGNGSIHIELCIVHAYVFHSADYIAEFTYARGLYEDSVGCILGYNLFECFAEVAHERTAYTTRIHLGYVDACILHKRSVYTDFAKFIFYKNKLFAFVGFGNELLYKRGFACPEKSREYVDFCHGITSVHMVKESAV